MNFNLALLLIIFACSPYAVSSTIEMNHCQAIPSSKKYIDYNFTGSFPKTAIFSCNYQCSTKNEQILINAISVKKITSSKDEAYSLVCQGVQVKKTNWGYDFDKVISFFIHDTDLVEVKRTARELGIDVDDQGSEYLMMKLKESFSEVSRSYAIAGSTNTLYSPDFLDASNQLALIVSDLPQSTARIDYYLDLLSELNNDFSSRPYSEQLLLNLVKTYARWRKK